MNTKRSKSKNRPKAVHVEGNSTLSEKKDASLGDVVNEAISLEDTTDHGETYTPDDVPKKPKRTKGKKKKDIVFEDHKIVEREKELTHQELDIQNVEDSEELTKKVPIVGKKKNKSKNSNTQLKDEKVNLSTPLAVPVAKEMTIEVISDPSTELNTEITEQTGEKVASLKKKKKKKHRHDSDKSDINDQQNCTYAFQKLLQSSVQCDQAISDSEKILDETEGDKGTVLYGTESESNMFSFLMDKNVEQPAKDAVKDEILKTKKKNKKGKKQPTTECLARIENKESHANEYSRENIDIQDDTNFTDGSPKPKAKIAKPVEKKAKMKTNLQDLKNEGILIKTTEQINLDDKTKEETLNIEEKDLTHAKIDTNIDTEIEVREQNISTTPEIANTTQDNNQFMSEKLKQDFNDFVTVTGKSNRNKKKKKKSVEDSSITESEKPLNILPNTKSLNVPEVMTANNIELEVVPDFIDYPRSISQLDVDNNNNTIIQEITTPEEVKLGIPIYISTPVIQGSGESPEVRIDKANVDIKVTEIDNNMPNSPNENPPNEKTDIKSKMIEVNRDMEELRRSIERSLAELTNTEKSGNEVEKEFEEIYQNQCQESNTAAITAGGIQSENEIVTLSVLKNECLDNLDKIANSSQTSPLKSQTSPKFEDEISTPHEVNIENTAPVCPARKDKGKGKSKKKVIQDHSGTQTGTSSTSTSVAGTTSEDTNNKSDQKSKKEEKSNQKSHSSEGKGKGKKRTAEISDDSNEDSQDKKRPLTLDLNFDPIENFEDALTSSVDDVNKTFELIANDKSDAVSTSLYQNNPEINIIAPTEDTEYEEEKRKQKEKKKQNQTPVSQPKNLLGHSNIPVQSNKVDYKREKHKEPNYIQAKVKIKDSVDIEKKSRDQDKTLENNKGELDHKNLTLYPKNTNEDLVYKYSFRKVFLQSVCHVCQKELNRRESCQFCSLVFYCSSKHKDEDWPQHQPLCFAVSTIAHLKGQKHIYADIKNITGQEYRILRMQVILSCEKILKRKLLAWEQEVLLYPRICADVSCREWRQGKLTDCKSCGQVSYCSDYPKHLPPTHQRWCKSYALYQKLVIHHQNFGKLEPKLPTKILEHYQLPDNVNEVLGSMYEEKIDISDIQYAALTQTATAPLTTLFCYQLCMTLHLSRTNRLSKESKFTIHSISNELRSEADSLFKWETFFLHLLSEVKELRVVLIDPDLHNSKLPLELLGKIKLCGNCQTNRRRVLFDFEDKNYHEYYSSNEFIVPNIVCAFNPSIHRSSIYDKDTWSSTIKCILKQKIPFIITSSSLEELKQDLGRIEEISAFDIITQPKYNPFASVRPDRNFITDHETPLMFKNFYYSVLAGA